MTAPKTEPVTKEEPTPGMLGGATGSQSEAKPEDPLYVPVTNLNYIPEGAGVPQGFVPDTPGNDRTLLRMKEALESQGGQSGPDVEPFDDTKVEAFMSGVIPPTTPSESGDAQAPEGETTEPEPSPVVAPTGSEPLPAETSSTQSSGSPLF
jgi:hypothetical protein